LIEILLQVVALICTIIALLGVKMMDMSVLPTIAMLCIIVFMFIFILAGGLSKRKTSK